MKDFPTFGEDSKPNSAISKIIQGAVGTPAILSDAPTSANGIVPEGEFAVFGNNLFYTSGGVTLKFTGTVV